MELDELKNVWAQYDKRLNENLKLNEKILRDMNLDKSKKELAKPIYWEIANVVVSVIVLAICIGFLITNISEAGYYIPAFIVIILTSIAMVRSISHIRKYAKIDFYNSSVVELQKQISSFKLLMLNNLFFDLIIMSIVMVCIFPILYKIIHNINIYEYMTFFVIISIVCIMLGILLSLLIYKYLYEKKISNAEHYINEIKKFESDCD